MVHNPIGEVKKILEEVKEYLEKDGTIFFDYWRPNPKDKIQSVKDFVIVDNTPGLSIVIILK